MTPSFKTSIGFLTDTIFDRRLMHFCAAHEKLFLSQVVGMATCRGLSLKAISSSTKISWLVGFSFLVLLIRTCYGTFGYTEICSLYSCMWSLGEGDELLEEFRQEHTLQITLKEFLCSHL